jgi:murein DD-endopeptidase MepM/ murein hydrolase activator NlpD
MRRSADTQPLEEKTQEELQRQAAQRTIRFGSAARDELRSSFEEDLAEGGVFLEPRELEALVEEAAGLLAAGEPRDEIGRRLGESARSAFLAFAPPDARHDDSTRYRLPFDASVPRRLEIGVGSGMAMTRSGAATGRVGHHGWSKYSFDFAAPPGSAILAARAGRVARVTTAFFERERQEGRTQPATAVFVAHDDGTFAIYGHLGDELRVGTGDRVAAGQPIGPAVGPRSHFGVVRRDGEGRLHSVDIRFADGSAEGFVPVQGSSYGGESGRAATGSP